MLILIRLERLGKVGEKTGDNYQLTFYITDFFMFYENRGSER